MHIFTYVTNPTRSKHFASIWWTLPATLMVSAALMGCNEPEFGEIRVPAERQYILPAGTAEIPLTLPADQPFAIHLKKSSQDAGPEGSARGDSNATQKGEAFCLAEVANGGKAAAEFSIGHRIDNHGSAQTAQIQCSFGLKQSLAASSQPSTETMASANLLLVVLDGRKKILGRLPIIQVSSDQASGDSLIQEQRNLTVSLEPNQIYDVMLFGQVQAGSASKQEARVRLEIEKLMLQFRFFPSATQPAGK
jgi:hypothetical protein